MCVLLLAALLAPLDSNAPIADVYRQLPHAKAGVQGRTVHHKRLFECYPIAFK